MCFQDITSILPNAERSSLHFRLRQGRAECRPSCLAKPPHHDPCLPDVNPWIYCLHVAQRRNSILYFNAVHGLKISQHCLPSSEVSGGAFLHSGVLVELSGTTFENNTAGEDGPAVMSLGQAHNISNVNFDGNTLYCGVGYYVAEKDGDNVRP